jgi:hypothetical protein
VPDQPERVVAPERNVVGAILGPAVFTVCKEATMRIGVLRFIHPVRRAERRRRLSPLV